MSALEAALVGGSGIRGDPWVGGMNDDNDDDADMTPQGHPDFVALGLKTICYSSHCHLPAPLPHSPSSPPRMRMAGSCANLLAMSLGFSPALF